MQPSRDLESWVRHLSRADIPVLRTTARELARLRDQTPDMLIRKVMQTVRAPDKPLETHVRVANA